MAEDKSSPTAQEGAKPTKRPPWWVWLWEWSGFGTKSGWNWLKLFSALAIPVVLAVAGLYFQSQLDQRQRQIEERRAQHPTLQAYLELRVSLHVCRILSPGCFGPRLRNLQDLRILFTGAGGSAYVVEIPGCMGCAGPRTRAVV